MEPRRRQAITPEVSLWVDPASGQPRAVSSSFPRETWKPRRPAVPGRSSHPGTALRVGESWFEIIAARPDPSRAGTTVYDLVPWDESFTIRVAEELTPEACRAAARRYREARGRERKGALLGLLALGTGLLPAEDQQRWEREYGVPATRATFLSGLSLLIGATLALVIGFAASQGHRFGDRTDFALDLWDWHFLFLYLFAESLARIAMSLSTSEPLGSIFVAGPIHVVRAVRDAWQGARRAPPEISKHAFSTVRDTVRPWGGPEADLEVLSRLPKEHWTVNVTSVVYRGTTYQLVDSRDLGEGVERYRFLLKVPEHEVLYQQVAEYEPEEVREIYRLRKRRDAATWVETFALVWGWLDQERQERLGAAYNYDPNRMTRRSILFNVLVGALAAAQGFVRMRSYGGLLDVSELFAGGLLLWECIVRWGHWKAGRLRESVLGILVRPAADRFLRWE